MGCACGNTNNKIKNIKATIKPKTRRPRPQNKSQY